MTIRAAYSNGQLSDVPSALYAANASGVLQPVQTLYAADGNGVLAKVWPDGTQGPSDPYYNDVLYLLTERRDGDSDTPLTDFSKYQHALNKGMAANLPVWDENGFVIDQTHGFHLEVNPAVVSYFALAADADITIEIIVKMISTNNEVYLFNNGKGRLYVPPVGSLQFNKYYGYFSFVEGRAPDQVLSFTPPSGDTTIAQTQFALLTYQQNSAGRCWWCNGVPTSKFEAGGHFLNAINFADTSEYGGRGPHFGYSPYTTGNGKYNSETSMYLKAFRLTAAARYIYRTAFTPELFFLRQ